MANHFDIVEAPPAPFEELAAAPLYHADLLGIPFPNNTAAFASVFFTLTAATFQPPAAVTDWKPDRPSTTVDTGTMNLCPSPILMAKHSIPFLLQWSLVTWFGYHRYFRTHFHGEDAREVNTMFLNPALFFRGRMGHCQADHLIVATAYAVGTEDAPPGIILHGTDCSFTQHPWEDFGHLDVDKDLVCADTSILLLDGVTQVQLPAMIDQDIWEALKVVHRQRREALARTLNSFMVENRRPYVLWVDDVPHYGMSASRVITPLPDLGPHTPPPLSPLDEHGEGGRFPVLGQGLPRAPHRGEL